jgi:hypothetical protein
VRGDVVVGAIPTGSEYIEQGHFEELCHLVPKLCSSGAARQPPNESADGGRILWGRNEPRFASRFSTSPTTQVVSATSVK